MDNTTRALEIALTTARGFKVLQCEECAAAIRRALTSEGYSGEVIELRARGRCDFILCASIEKGKSTVTRNGRHLGVRVGDTVFDNLHARGIPFAEWLSEFDAPDGVFVYRVDSF